MQDGTASVVGLCRVIPEVLPSASQHVNAHRTTTMNAVPAPSELLLWKHAVDQRLDALLPAHQERNNVCGAMREGVLGAGKRVRPLMLMGVRHGFGEDPMQLIDAACAVEMVHAASLFLDDLPCMDDALERRGRPALHVQYGEDVALLASVALLSLAFRTVAACEGIRPDARNEIVTLLADTIGPCGLVQGQFQDLRANPQAHDAEALTAVNELKTGALFQAAMSIPAIAAGADRSTIDDLRTCAGHIGQAFQLRDDLEDGVATANGRHVDVDGHPTLVTLLGPRNVRAKFDAHVQAASVMLGQLFPVDCVLRSLLDSMVPAERPRSSARLASKPVPAGLA